MHALVSLSRAESAGLIVREFVARGTPTIAINLGGIGEMVRAGLSWILFEEMSQLDPTLSFAIRNQSLIAQLGIHANFLAEENNLEVVAARYSKLYQTSSEKRRRG
jgi:glycosyltransferase involved in cell wall biosynthesis